MRLISVLFAFCVLTAPATAADHYVAPLGAKATCPADGSKQCPWPSVSAGVASKKVVGGDTILLMDGFHGTLQTKDFTFSSTVTIQSENGSNARISNVTFGSTAKHVRLRNLKVWRDQSDTGTSFLIRAYAGSSYLTFENLDVRSREDSLNYLKWTKTRWAAVATRAFDLRGAFNVVRNNKITGVKEGIIAGPDSIVENNVIDGFAGDGMKGVSRSRFRNNVIKNSVAALDGYHRDGFQSHSSGNPIDGLTLENNTFIQWTHDPSNPLTAPMQGIGMFDGWYDNLVIQNNLVVTNHSHGISVYGTRGARIVNNTVVNLAGKIGTVPYLKVRAKKDGSPSRDVLVANNLAMQIQVTASIPYNVVVVKNSAIVNPATSFENVGAFNYYPKGGTGWIDTADVGAAPTIDIVGQLRSTGVGPDRGAYEVQQTTSSDSTVAPAISPTTTTTTTRTRTGG